jgi:activator of 2-hydroxyglutaryl-CoA dehydratase
MSNSKYLDPEDMLKLIDGVVTKLGEKLDGIEITVPEEPQIAGALGAALFAFDRAKKKGPQSPPCERK